MRYLLWHFVTESARTHPSRPAIIDGERSLTYEELDRRSDAVALALLSEGIGRGSRVGLFLPKSAEGVIAMVGTLKAGAAYVPVDPSAPARRGAYILEDCRVSGLVTSPEMLSKLDGWFPLASLDLVLLASVDGNSGGAPAAVGTDSESPPIRLLGELERADPGVCRETGGSEIDPAYLLYTSGSTGRPKGVILSHRAAMTFVEWAADTVGLSHRDRLSNHAPFHFDLSVFDLYAAFRSGACVVLVPEEIAPFPFELTRWIREQEITVWYSVPSALIRLLLRGRLTEVEHRELRTVIFAGEVFPVKYLRQVMDALPRAEFFNWYGPTETNVCTYYRVPRPLDVELENLPIGRACENTEVVAVDEDDRPIGVGDRGELLVRGPTVMLGYWGLPERTAEQLVENPFQPAYREPMYRTGDIVRREADGNYTFVGRRDHMVKSRGYRIELGEIEALLYRHESVREAAVVALPDEEIGARLAAVVVPREGETLQEAGLRAFCARSLPKYMVPEAYAIRSSLPRTSTGKTDRTALESEFERPADPAESEERAQ